MPLSRHAEHLFDTRLVEITGTVIGTRRQQDVASTHIVYILDGMRELHTYSNAIVPFPSPKVGDKIRVECFGAATKEVCVHRIHIQTE